MSYPRKIQILVVEDEQDPIDGYRALFTFLSKKYPMISPIYVRCFQEAKDQIEGNSLFHVVILDLNLPIANKENPADGLAPSEQLLELLAQRDTYPVPVLLVISGKLNLARLSSLTDRLAKDFWYGKLVNKSSEQSADIEEGLAKAQEYCDVGIHIRDSGEDWYPTLSPREEDMLRRSVKSQTHCLGVDLEWWDAESGPSVSRPSPDAGTTKVLMGHFLLDDGLGQSIPTFFKFEPAENGPFVCKDVGILSQKLGHVKLYATSTSRRRSLIVTQSVTNHGWPVSLNEYLHQTPPDSVDAAIPDLVGDVVVQLEQLGGATEDQVQARHFLWRHLDRRIIQKAWEGCDTSAVLSDGSPNPLNVFDAVASNERTIWADRRACIHGDLNATNVAVDIGNPGRPQAYIFDAAGMQADLEFRDLSTLEVTTILYNSNGLDTRLLQACRPFYSDAFLPEAFALDPGSAPIIRNVASMLLSIRTHVRQLGKEKESAYAMLVFDAVMRQLFGLGVQPSRNKIKNPLHACYLAAWTAHWIRRVNELLLD
jgi:hypothetical protein